MKLTVGIIVVTLAMFIGQLTFPGFTFLFALTPTAAFSGAVWQFVTYLFLHGGAEHILINMVVLLIFGVSVERALGTLRFAALYVISGIGSALLYIALTGIDTSLLLGASGAVFGVMVAFAMLFPEQRLVIFPLPIPIRAPIAVGLIALFEIVAGITGILPGIANFGHVGGLLTGFLIIRYYQRIGRRRRPPG